MSNLRSPIVNNLLKETLTCGIESLIQIKSEYVELVHFISAHHQQRLRGLLPAQQARHLAQEEG